MNLLNLLTNLYVAPASLSAGACLPTTSLVENSWLLYFVCRMGCDLKAVELCLLSQKMLPCNWKGVLFSGNPSTGTLWLCLTIPRLAFSVKEKKKNEILQLIHLHTHAYYTFPVGTENKTKAKQKEGGRPKVKLTVRWKCWSVISRRRAAVPGSLLPPAGAGLVLPTVLLRAWGKAKWSRQKWCILELCRKEVQLVWKTLRLFNIDGLVWQLPHQYRSNKFFSFIISVYLFNSCVPFVVLMTVIVRIVYIRGVIFHSQKAPYWKKSLLVMSKYKIALVCIKRLPVNTCLDSSKKSTLEQNNTSETWVGYLSCNRDLSPSIYPDGSISLNSRANT